MDTATQIRQPIADAFREYENLYEQTMRSDNALLDQVLRYISDKRGKQLRPTLVLLAAQLCREINDKTLRTAVALEMTHNASLVHDDVVDSSPMRRGAPSVQAKWSNKIAVLVGDWMLARMINLIGEIRNAQILGIVSAMASALSSGEILQLHTNSTMWISEQQYYDIIGKKTAELFAACTQAGAISAGCSYRQQTALRTYGYELGLIFQLKDDVLDYSDAEDIGKPTMSDISDGKATLPLLIALQRAPHDEAQQIRTIAEQLAERQHADNLQAQTDIEQQIKNFVLRYDGVGYTYSQMRMHRNKAEEALSIFHDSETKQALITLLEYIITRMY
ncbi:MAG: polyprenyl synthetase family protein [Paludibacteraceae bacterium]|nr:polyprenyl synthetase family protein [Paludibacteraceae bacterium]